MHGRIRIGAAALLLLGLNAFAPPATESAAAHVGTFAPPHTQTPIAGWHLQSSAVATAGGEVLSRPEYDPAGWYRVSARSTVMAGLIENGRYPADLFHSTNLQKVDKAPFQVPWWYRETIVADASSQHTTLRVAGVTSKADVWFNGTLLTTLAGSHNATQIDVSRALRPGRNGLAIKVFPADANRDFTIGWIDWNPYPPDNNMGIWQDVTLHRTGGVSLAKPRVRTKPMLNRWSMVHTDA